MDNTNKNPSAVGILLSATALLCLGILANAKPHIYSGLPAESLENVVGEPVSVMRAGATTALLYKQHEFIGFGWRTVDYTVIVKDGIVAEYGHGAAQPSALGGLTLTKAHE